ncbi:MAG TPA: hypothetical protein P5201_10830, partial [Aminobacteriaceae bacterium]|nr:hypothetical protein [Aminobacteriaceae bacterium]
MQSQSSIIDRVFLVLLLIIVAHASPSEAASARHIVLLPTLNYTEYEIWESKYYPVNVLEQKMTEYLASLLRQNPFTDVSILDDSQAQRWMDDPY